MTPDDLRARDELEQKLARHARQQEAVARVGQFALREQDLRTLMTQIVDAVAETLDVELCGVLKLRDDEEVLDIAARVGQRDSGTRALSAGRGTPAGYALSKHRPVVVEDLRTETRFDAKALFAALDERRKTAGMTWRQVAAEIGGVAAPSMLTRLQRRGRVDVNLVVAATGWLGVSVEDLARETDR